MRSRTIGFGSLFLLLILAAASASAEPAGLAGGRFVLFEGGLFKPAESCWKIDSERSFYRAGVQVPVHPGLDLSASAAHDGSGDFESDVWGAGVVLHADPAARITPVFHIALYHLAESVPGPDPDGEEGLQFGAGLEFHRLKGFTLLAAIAHTDVGTSDFLLTTDLVRWFGARFLADLSAGYGWDTETARVSFGVGAGF